MLVDERENTFGKHEQKLAEIASREDQNATHDDKQLLRDYREQLEDYDSEIADLTQEIERAAKAAEESKKLRRILAGNAGVDLDGDAVVYPTMSAFARDVILTRESTICSQIANRIGDKDEISRARERLQLIKRVPANTLSSNVGGLQPNQHIAQIFQIIDSTRPIVASARRTTLDRGTLSYPKVTTRPIVAVQSSQKTEAGNQGMVIDMLTTTASTYLGGGDLSWQAINWSTPDALQLWFDLCAADYALKTEQDAAQVMQHSGFTYTITTKLSSTATFAEFMTAVGAGAANVFANSGRVADTVYMAPDRYWYIFGTTSTALAQFASVSGGGVGPLRFVASRGMDSGVIVVGDSAGLLVAETAGAPVELRVVEPAIGGVEVGLIGAFEAVVVDPGAFSMITTAS